MSTAPAVVMEAFTAAAITALMELTQLEAYPEPGTPTVEGNSGQNVLAIIHLQRETPGTMTLVVPAEVVSQLAARYLPEGTQLTEDLMNDVAGEFANVIAGQAKTMLKGTAHHFSISTPRVTRGADLAGLMATDIVVQLATEIGRLTLVIALP